MILESGYDTEAIYIDVSPENVSRLYWGRPRFPRGSKVLGVIHRYAGDAGALIRLKTGVLVQGNAGVLKSLPQSEVEKALKRPRWLP